MCLFTCTFGWGTQVAIKFFLDAKYTTDALEKLRREASADISYAFLQRYLVEHPRINEVLCDFGDGDNLHLYRFGHLGKPVRSDKKMFILP